MKFKLALFFLLKTILLIGQEEQLIVFTQTSDQKFIEQSMPLLKSLSEDEDIALFSFKAEEGLPDNITSTPAIIYRNGNGSSTYAGRYTSFTTIKNFIRSARVASKTETKLEKQDVLVRKDGKMLVAAALKVTDIKSIKPTVTELLKNSEYLETAKNAIRKGLNQYVTNNSVKLHKTDRIFYLDFHPYHINKDSLILSIELYSQFNCIDPIFKSKINGSNLEEVFMQAAIELQNEINKSLSNSDIGDAYTAVSGSIQIRNLNDLDIPQPKSETRKYNDIDINKPMPTKWKFKNGINGRTPVLQFNFKEPLTRYTGEIKSIDGTINLNNQNEIISGTFEAVMKSLTMGEESFDKKVLKEYVKARSHPTSIFTTSQILVSEPLSWQNTSTVTIKGFMKLMKKKRPITVTASLTPFINNDNQETLLVQANWSMNITDGWGIQGPDGPTPAKKTLEFSLNIIMEPVK